METIVIQLQRFTQSRLAWGLLFISALVLEISALFFQYEMKLDPCVMCIYIRVAMLGLMIAGIIGLLAPKSLIARVLGLATWITSAVWGLKLALELNEMQVNPSPFATCSFFPEFPSFMPLDKWLPSVFSPTGMCSDLPWTFLSISMVQWMIGIFVIYCIAWLIVLVPTLKPLK